MKPFYSAATALLIALLLTGLTGSPLFAQQKSIENLFEVNLRNFGAIRNDDAVTGYYFFYETEGKKKRDRAYTVSLLDQNLEQIGSKTIEGDRFLELREGVYNGNALALKFANSKEEEFTIRLLDEKGEQISSRRIDFGAFDDPRYQQAGGGMMGDQTLFSVPGKGFVHYAFDTRKGIMSPTYYSIRFFPSDGNRDRAWDHQSPQNNRTWEAASFLAAGEDVLLSTVVKREGLMSRDLEYYVLASDLNTGKQLFEKSLEDDQYALMVTNAWVQDDAVRLFGLYYEKDAKVVKEESLGLFAFTMTMEGEIRDRRYLSWETDLKAALPRDEKGEVMDIGYLYFHDFITTPDGTVYGVAENYRKTADALGITGKVLSLGGGGGSVAKMVVEDLFLLQFSPDFAVEDILVVPKTKHDVSLPAGAAYMSPQILSFLVLYYQGFDYAFTQRDDDLFSVGYVDFEKRQGEKNGLVYGAVTYLDGELTTDKIDLQTEADEQRVLPAKTGYIAVWEYFRKDKKMDIRLERVNF